MSIQHRIRVTTDERDSIVLRCDNCDEIFFNNNNVEASFNRLNDSVRRHKKQAVKRAPVEKTEEAAKDVNTILTTSTATPNAATLKFLQDAVDADKKFLLSMGIEKEQING